MDKIFLSLAVIVAAVSGGFLLKEFLSKRSSPKNFDAIKTQKEVIHEIEKTPAGDLVNTAPNSDRLHANAASIAKQAKQRLRDRVGNIISGLSNTGNLGDDGN